MKLKIPPVQQETKTNSIIPVINSNIRDILTDVLNLQSEVISETNETNFKEILDKADIIIVECHTTQTFNGNRNKDFSRLSFEYQRLKLKYESYLLNKQINLVNEEYAEIKKQQENLKLSSTKLNNQISTIDQKNKELEEQQNNLKAESNNLIYNILGFIASFSVVSAAISAIDTMQNLSQIMLFMAFTVFILLTTLIGLNNFYRKNEKKKFLQDNYFLWKMMLAVIIMLFGYVGVENIIKNSDYILEMIGRGIGQTYVTYEKVTINNETQKNN